VSQFTIGRCSDDAQYNYNVSNDRGDRQKAPMKRHLLWLSILMRFGSVGAPSAEARQSAPPTRTKIDVSKLGPQVGERVPDFGLKDQNGKARTLQSIMGPKGAMLVFIRSADW
jgi:hypothetical protein